MLAPLRWFRAQQACSAVGWRGCGRARLLRIASSISRLALLFGLFVVPALPEEAKPQLVFSPWQKRCVLAPEVAGKRTCTTMKEGRVESGMPAVAAVLIELENEPRKVLRVTVPLGMSIQHGTRVIVDNGQPMTSPYANCSVDGCTADYEASAELIGKLKKGQGLAVQAINGTGQPISLVVPLAGFAKAYDGPIVLQPGAQTKPRPARSVSGQEQIIFSPWTKFCLKGQEANAKQVCFTGKDGRLESGTPVIAAVLLEPENEPKKVLRVTLPVDMSIQHGTRVILDNGQPMSGPYVICFNNGCMADYEASGELIGRLKKGRELIIQGIDGGGGPITLVMPLADFAKAYDGPPTDPKVYEQEQAKLQGELRRRAEEARRKLEGLQPAIQSSDRPVVAAAPANAPPMPLSIDPGRRVALVIGNSGYQSVSVLPNPQLDAATIAAALRRVGFQSVKLEFDLGRERLIDALRGFAREAETADWALIYYAGHSIEVNGINYLVPVDAKLEIDREVELEAVSLNQIMNALEGAKKLRIVLLDACRDNPFARLMRRSVATRSIGRGLARVEPDGGTIVAYAAKHGEIALDGDIGTNSPFVSALVKYLPSPGLEINKLFRLVRDDVMKSTNRKQEPFVYGSLPGEDFFFVAGK